MKVLYMKDGHNQVHKHKNVKVLYMYKWHNWTKSSKSVIYQKKCSQNALMTMNDLKLTEHRMQEQTF